MTLTKYQCGCLTQWYGPEDGYMPLLLKRCQYNPLLYNTIREDKNCFLYRDDREIELTPLEKAMYDTME